MARSHIIRISAVSLLFAATTFVALGASARDWSAHDPSSAGRIDHELWGKIVTAITFEYDKVANQVTKSTWDCRNTTSRISTCDTGGGTNINMKGINFVPYDQINPEIDFFLSRYILNMSKVQISDYSKDEQLAYWLNVHNAAVIKQIHRNYPIDNMHEFRDRPRENFGEGRWYEKIINVEGESLSIHDIEQNIIFENWTDPLVIYGLFDGSVGSPRISRVPFDGRNVYSQLRNKAKIFVNSPRVMRLRGDFARLSLTYAWAHKIFANEREALDHIKSLANEKLQRRLEDIERVRASFYDFALAKYKLPSSNWVVDLQRVQRFVENGSADLVR